MFLPLFRQILEVERGLAEKRTRFPNPCEPRVPHKIDKFALNTLNTTNLEAFLDGDVLVVSPIGWSASDRLPSRKCEPSGCCMESLDLLIAR